jgi:dihydrolipoamide dehydrogenase
MSKAYDVVVVGAGPGGYVAAIRAAQLGFSVAIIEKEKLGGVCLNWGCIPTKALLKTSELNHAFAEAAEFGLISKEKPTVDIEKVIGRSRDVAAKLSGGIGFLMKKNKIDVLEGTAKLTSKTRLSLSGKTTEKIDFKYAIVATGARAKQIPGVLEADGEHIWTAREAMTPKKMPKSLLIIGAGAIGVEFASFYANLGVPVTIVEAQDRIVPAEDEEIAKLLKKALEKQGITIHTKAKINGLKAGKSGVTADLELKGKAKAEKFDKAILAIGVTGNVEGLGLETLGIKTERNHIKANKFYQTNVPNIYAIGDVIGAPWLAHVASHEGTIAAEHIAFAAKKGKKPHGFDYGNVPGCTYCRPQVASTGLSEAAAKEQGYDIKVGRYNYQANGKALAIGEPDGLVKTIFDAKTGELLGAHIIGAEATEMISTFVVAKHLETTEEDLINACFPHPTLSEMLHESVLDSEGRVVNA